MNGDPNQQALNWVTDMMTELQTTEVDKAFGALRAGLQALRDQLSVAAAAQLSAQLPFLVRGLVFEGWTPSGKKPTCLRPRAQFLELVREKYAPRTDVDPKDIIAALSRVIARHVTAGEISDIVLSSPGEFVELIEDDASSAARS